MHEHEVSLNRVMTSILKDVNGLETGPEDLPKEAESAQYLENIDAHDIAITR